ncbi:MAG: sigma-70 family RNA polymerase sigma factor [Chitinophagales bacterium]|nr:sigma-70 family RNA polymerase sigma factor [Chitinophagales bacterium]HAE12930.1 RNA polymerase subunit sigma-70 [Bacteroidota bacterium]MCB9021184.1 sigma-70 family RNA polymerase sigma factor [Chitinophagales bacterium]MCB9032189.1 sigma-70 family RNA polymerase sigma factor [Chitinophagales bacterium]HAE35863.1 RNA polymerase subunit sigma-70 [Bacteroidota bacterium]
MNLFSRKEQVTVQDEVLLTQYRISGDLSIVGELYKRYSHLVFGVCMKYLKNEALAEDLSMQVFEKLITDLKNHEVNNFRPWLHMVTRNECLMHLRRDKKMRVVELEPGRTEDDDADVVEFASEEHLDDVHLKEEQLVMLEAGIRELNEDQRTCIELFFLHKRSYQEIADLTGYDLNKVKSYIQNGKRNLRIYMEKRNAG